MEIITNVFDTPLGPIVQRIMPLPNKVKACVMMDSDGVPNIYIDPSSNIQKEFKHEYDHLRFCDMDGVKPIELVEDYL